jgi:adenylosuccinate synthase
MPISIIVGGQFGSEGKGKVAAYFSNKLSAAATIRVGGPNSGHTVYNDSGKKFIFKQLPTSSIYNNNFSIIAAGSYINLEILLREIELVRLKKGHLIIDPKAIMITNEDIENEKTDLRTHIGSTCSGTGSAVRRRTGRKNKVLFAKDVKELDSYVTPTVPILRDLLDKKERILIEGTQGFGLSLIHSEHYPYTTSRDTSAAGFLSETGLSPLDVDDVIMVIRAFPIRVAGNSGPLKNEVNWEFVTKKSGHTKKVIEYTSVSNNVRRVGLFDSKLVKKAVEVNTPTRIVLNHLDYIDKPISKGTFLSKRVISFISEVEQKTFQKINYLGFSPYDLVQNNNREIISYA